MSDVFVSYKAEDRRRIRPLVEALESDGYSVWWDEHIGGGASWRDAIETELDGAKCVIVAWSKRSVGREGQFVRDEASRAQRRGTYLPVLIDNVEPPLGFGETQAISVAAWKGGRSDKRYQVVLAGVRSIIEGKPVPAGSSVRFEPTFSRRAAVAGGAAAVVAAASAGWFLFKPTAAAAKTIAVMPFANLSGDPAQAYFSDGLAEELRSALSRIAQLQVVARTSSEAVRNEDVKTAAHKLGVANVLAGSVRRSPSTIRINAQLIDGSTGLERWSQSFDQPIGDSLAIQTSIAQSVADALSIQLGQEGKAALTLGGTTNVNAYELLLKSDPARSDDTKVGMERSLAFINAALDLDPQYAQAFARKALTLNGYTGFYAETTEETEEGLAKAEAAARRAIALAPNLAQAHVALAQVLKNQIRFKPAFSELQRGVRLGPNSAEAQSTYAFSLSQLGRYKDAWEAVRRAEALDPLNPRVFQSVSNIQLAARQYPAAAATARRALALAPGWTSVRSALSNALLLEGRLGDAEAEYSKLPPADVHGLMGLAVVAALNHDIGKSDTLVAKIREKFGDNASYQYVQIYAQRREADAAITNLRRAVEVRDPGLAGIKVDPFLDPIRGDPRLVEIIRALGFPA